MGEGLLEKLNGTEEVPYEEFTVLFDQHLKELGFSPGDYVPLKTFRGQQALRDRAKNFSKRILKKPRSVVSFLTHLGYKTDDYKQPRTLERYVNMIESRIPKEVLIDHYEKLKRGTVSKLFLRNFLTDKEYNLVTEGYKNFKSNKDMVFFGIYPEVTHQFREFLETNYGDNVYYDGTDLLKGTLRLKKPFIEEVVQGWFKEHRSLSYRAIIEHKPLGKFVRAELEKPGKNFPKVIEEIVKKKYPWVNKHDIQRLEAKHIGSIPEDQLAIAMRFHQQEFISDDLERIISSEDELHHVVPKKPRMTNVNSMYDLRVDSPLGTSKAIEVKSYAYYNGELIKNFQEQHEGATSWIDGVPITEKFILTTSRSYRINTLHDALRDQGYQSLSAGVLDYAYRVVLNRLDYDSLHLQDPPIYGAKREKLEAIHRFVMAESRRALKADRSQYMRWASKIIRGIYTAIDTPPQPNEDKEAIEHLNTYEAFPSLGRKNFAALHTSEKVFDGGFIYAAAVDDGEQVHTWIARDPSEEHAVLEGILEKLPQETPCIHKHTDNLVMRRLFSLQIGGETSVLTHLFDHISRKHTQDVLLSETGNKKFGMDTLLTYVDSTYWSVSEQKSRYDSVETGTPYFADTFEEFSPLTITQQMRTQLIDQLKATNFLYDLVGFS